MLRAHRESLVERSGVTGLALSGSIAEIQANGEKYCGNPGAVQQPPAIIRSNSRCVVSLNNRLTAESILLREKCCVRNSDSEWSGRPQTCERSSEAGHILGLCVQESIHQ